MSAVKIISTGLPQPKTESEWLEWRLIVARR